MKFKFISGVLAAAAMVATPIAEASLATYSINQTYKEPAYGGLQDTFFNGTFTYDTVTKSITNLTGTLSEAMTFTNIMDNSTQKKLNLTYNPVASSIDANGGITAHAFLLNTTNIFSDGNFDTSASTKLAGLANAYVSIYVTSAMLNGAIGQGMALAAANFSHLYYGDCQPGGMMGPTCMTGWGQAGAWGGTSGSMGGYPTAELVTKLSEVAAVPLPGAIWLFLSGVFGFLSRGKRRNQVVA